MFDADFSGGCFFAAISAAFFFGQKNHAREPKQEEIAPQPPSCEQITINCVHSPVTAVAKQKTSSFLSPRCVVQVGACRRGRWSDGNNCEGGAQRKRVCALATEQVFLAETSQTGSIHGRSIRNGNRTGPVHHDSAFIAPRDFEHKFRSFPPNNDLPDPPEETFWGSGVYPRKAKHRSSNVTTGIYFQP